MRFVCLCPTYKKPKRILDEAINCFLGQTHKNAFLLIYDDFGSLSNERQENLRIVSSKVREPDMISKYEKMLEISSEEGEFDAMALWDDDDIYLPRHLETHALVLGGNEFSHPDKVWTTHNAEAEKDGKRLEDSTMSYWASSAIRMESLKKHGFVKVTSIDFDLINLHHWTERCSTGNPCKLGDPTYVYRWAHTGCWHCSSFHKDLDWYSKIGLI